LSLPQFKLLRPRTVDEAVSHLAKHAAKVRILAGGTDLIPSMQQKLFEPEYVLDLRSVAGLRGIRSQANAGAEIGALTPLREIERSTFLQIHYSVLSQAAATVASPVLRNMGTVGGNICLDTRCLWYNQSLTWRKG
jgi:4-hydroxybenzoyl-CoA reductase subunit beta